MNMTDRYMEERELTDGSTVAVFKQNWFMMEHSNRGRNTDRIEEAQAHCEERGEQLGGCIVTEPLDLDNHNGEAIIQHIKECGVGGFEEDGWVKAVTDYVFDMECQLNSLHAYRPNAWEREVQDEWKLNIYITGMTAVLLTLLRELINHRDEKWLVDITFWNWCNDTGYYPITLAV